MVGATKFEFKNVVAVRFSVRNKVFESKFISNQVARERWFEFRAKLFYLSLGASLAAQSLKPVATFLYFDASDEKLVDKYFPRIDFHPVFSDSHHDTVMGEQLLKKGLSENVVLSRIDSDDIVEGHYFAKINALLEKKREESSLPIEAAVVCKHGYRTNFVKMQRIFHISPPFISQYFSNYSGQAAYFNHTKLGARHTTQIEVESAEWLQIIHGTNVANKFKRGSMGANEMRELQPKPPQSQFGTIDEFDPVWFENWACIPPISPEFFAEGRLPIEGLRAKLRYAMRRWLGQA